MTNKNVRDIIQISESISTDSRIPMWSLTALCNDGSVWRLIGDNWKPLPIIPQYELDEEPDPEYYPDSDIEPAE